MFHSQKMFFTPNAISIILAEDITISNLKIMPIEKFVKEILTGIMGEDVEEVLDDYNRNNITPKKNVNAVNILINSTKWFNIRTAWKMHANL